MEEDSEGSDTVFDVSMYSPGSHEQSSDSSDELNQDNDVNQDIPVGRPVRDRHQPEWYAA